MTLPVVIPNTFANATSTIPLSQLDNNFTTVVVAVNGIDNGAETLSNVQISGGNAVFTTANATTSAITNLSSSNVTITGGTVDNVTATNVTISSGNVTITNVSATVVDTTNLEVTNIKALDGTAAASIANSTGIITVSTQLNVDNLNLSGNAITSTDTNGNIDLTPNGTGEVNISKVDIDAGTIDGTTIGGSTAAAGSFTTLAASSSASLSSTLGVTGAVTLSNLTASQAVFTDGSKVLVSNAITGTGNVVMSTSPTLTTPDIGTPSAGTLTNCTGLPISTGVSGLGANVATFLATPSSANLAAAVSDETGSGALVFANSPTLVTPALGTPSSGTLTNCTGLPIATGVSGLGSNVATFLATPSSANLAAAVSDETGSGSVVFNTAPTFATSVTLNAQAPLRLADSDSSHYVALQAPATVASNVTWTMPSVDGTNGQALVTDGSGTLSWAAAAGSPGGSDTQLQYNSSGSFAGASGLVTDGSNLTINAQGDLRFADSDSSNWVAFQAPATVASNITWTLPNADGTSGQFLSTDGSGALSWATASGGGGGGGTSTTTTQFTATSGQTSFTVSYTVNQISVYLNGALLAAADYTATNGTSVVLASGAASGDILTVVAYSTVTTISQGNSNVTVTDSGTGKIEFNVDAVEVADFTTGAVVFNETGANQDFRIEGDTDANLFFVDASTDRLGIGTNTPGYKLHLIYPVSDNAMVIDNGGGAGDNTNPYLAFSGTNGGSNYIRGRIRGALPNSTDGGLVFDTGSSGSMSERARITSAGELLVGKTTTTANGGVVQVSNGITFPATQSACSDVNTLDDYEEGSFTVTYTASSGSFGAITYTGQDGYYVKIGRVVFFNFTISTSAVTIGTASGELRISGFPFTAGLTNQASNSTFAGRSSGFSGEEPFAMSMLLNTTSGELFYKTSVDGNTINSAPNDLTTSGSGNIIVMNGFYYV